MAETIMEKWHRMNGERCYATSVQQDAAADILSEALREAFVRHEGKAQVIWTVPGPTTASGLTALAGIQRRDGTVVIVQAWQSGSVCVYQQTQTSDAAIFG